MAKKKSNALVRRWDNYFGENTLENWQRLVGDLGIDGHFPSKTQCRKAIEKVHVNIRDFLDSVRDGTTVRKFRSRQALANYTIATHRVYPRKKVAKGSPLAALLSNIF